MKLQREKQKVMTLHEIVKGRTGKPETHTPLCNREGKNRNPIPMYPCKYEGKNRNPRPYISNESEKGKNRNPRPLYPCESNENMKGRTETQYPV